MKNNKPVIAIDAMGGDFGPSVVVPGSLRGAKNTDSKVILVGREEQIRSALSSCEGSELEGELFEVINADETVEMTDNPSDILRHKKNSSMQVACRLVKDSKADAVISAGHSGAVFMCSTFILGKIPGVERAALAAMIPTEKKPTLVLDVGANVECRSHHLLQFALMGEIYVKNILGYENPRVAILSIGEEEGKGNSLAKEAYALLKQVPNINFIGNAEGRDLFNGNVDVAVCDGFVGNIVLKSTEGLIRFLYRSLKYQYLNNGLLTKFGALLCKGAFSKVMKSIDHEEMGGVPLLGLKGLSLVCHGASSEKSIASAIRVANTYIRTDTQEHLVAAISANEELANLAGAL